MDRCKRWLWKMVSLMMPDTLGNWMMLRSNIVLAIEGEPIHGLSPILPRTAQFDDPCARLNQSKIQGYVRQEATLVRSSGSNRKGKPYNQSVCRTRIDDFAVPDFHRDRLSGHPKVHWVGDGDRIDGMRLIEAPGHTQGLFALDVAGDVLASDAIKNRAELSPEHPLSNTWNREVARRSIDRISQLAKRTIYPGHDVPLVRDGETWVAARLVEEWIMVSPGVAPSLEDPRFQLRIERT